MEHAILNETIDGQKVDFYPETGFEDVVDLDNNNKTLKTVVGELQDALTDHSESTTAHADIRAALTTHNASATAHPNGLAFPLMTWVEGTAYAVNAVVVYDKKIYQCVTANSDSTFTKAKWNNIGGGDGVPVGAVVPFSGNGDYPTGYLLCNGESVSRTMYPDLFSVIGTTFGAADDTHFNLPDLRDKFVEGAETAGTNKSAGLPNITGSWIPVESTYIDGTYSGAFGKTSGSATRNYSRDYTGAGAPSLTFDASKSNSIYGNSTTVQPPALTMRYVIKAFDGQTADSALVDVTQYANELTDIRAKYLPLSGGELSGETIGRNVDNSYLELHGGTSADDGGYMYVTGQNHSQKGGFALIARNSTDGKKALQGFANGALIWNNREIKSMAFPSTTKVNFAIANDGTYTAPANGWVTFEGAVSEDGPAYIQAVNGANLSTAICTHSWSNYTMSVTIPVSKGNRITCLTRRATNLAGYFVYAQGEV